MQVQDTANKYGTVADFNAKNFTKRYVFVLNHQNPSPSLQDRHFPISVVLPMIDEVFDHEKGRKRRIRHVSGEQSIFEDEQNFDKNKTTRNEYIQFSKDGDLIVDGRDVQKLEWLMKSNFNGSNPGRDPSVNAKYWMVDLGSNLKVQREKDEKLTNAKQWCYESHWDQAKSYARVLGIPVESRDPDEIRMSLVYRAEQNPVLFLAGLNNKLTERKHYVLEAIDKGILKVDRTTSSLSWANGSNICISPMGKDPIDHFVDLTETEEGQRTYDSVYGLIAPSAKPAVKITSELHDVAPKTVYDSVVPKEKKTSLINSILGKD